MQPTEIMNYADPWLEARQYTASLQAPVAERLQAAVGGRAAKLFKLAQSAVIDRSKLALIIDLNKYRPGCDLKAFKEHGVDHVILRMGGPKYFWADNWALEEDVTYRGYYEQARSLGMKVGGYFVYSAGVDQANYETSEENVSRINEIMGRDYKPDYLYIDDEVDYWWEGSRKVYATGVNQVKGLRILIDKCWKNFRLVTGHYSARWFMNKYRDQYTNWLDVVNRSEKVVPNWYAWYPIALTTTFSNCRDIVGKLPIPTSTQENNYLNCGSFGLYDLWQFTSNMVTPYCPDPVTMRPPYGVDVSISRLPLADFEKAMGIKATQPVPEPEPADPTYAQRLTALETDMANVKARLTAIGA